MVGSRKTGSPASKSSLRKAMASKDVEPVAVKVAPAETAVPTPVEIVADAAEAVTKTAEAIAKPVSAEPVAVPATKPAPKKRGPYKPRAAKLAAATPAAKSTAKPAPKPRATPSKPVTATSSASRPSAPKGSSVMATKTFTPSFPSFVPMPENMQAMFGEFQSRAKASVEKSAKMMEEMGDFAKGNVEAVMTSGRVAAKGAETLGQDAAEYSKKSLESATAAFKTFASAKSPTELFTLQSDYARKSFDSAVADMSKFSEAWLKLAGEIVQPLSSRVALAAEKIKTPLN